jgi:hypothetical protein
MIRFLWLIRLRKLLSEFETSKVLAHHPGFSGLSTSILESTLSPAFVAR